MRLLILASPFDAVADAVALPFEAAGHSAVRCSLEDLAAARWVHRVGVSEPVTEIRLADGQKAAGDVVLNRLRYEPTLLYTRMAAGDRDYARSEFHAVLLSWLASLGASVVGRPSPSGLGGVALGAWQWLAAAAAAGFPVCSASATTSARLAPSPRGSAPWPDLLPGAGDRSFDLLGPDRPVAAGPKPSARRRVVVVGDCLVGQESPALAGSAVGLARAVAADILVIDLAQSGDDPTWRFVGATSMPERLDAPALDALVSLVEARR